MTTRRPILVLLDVSPAGELGTSAAELLGAAARVGIPVALVVAAPGTGHLAATAAGALGAERVLVAETADVSSTLTAPLVDALVAAYESVAPDAVIISNTIDGRDVAGRFAVRTRNALAVDAVGIDRDDEGIIVHHSVYGGGYVADSAVTFGTPVVTVREGGVEDRAPAASPTIERLEFTAGDGPAIPPPLQPKSTSSTPWPRRSAARPAWLTSTSRP